MVVVYGDPPGGWAGLLLHESDVAGAIDFPGDSPDAVALPKVVRGQGADFLVLHFVSPYKNFKKLKLYFAFAVIILYHSHFVLSMVFFKIPKKYFDRLKILCYHMIYRRWLHGQLQTPLAHVVDPRP